MPHGFCYTWQSELIWFHAVSDALIALAYFSIPLALLRVVRLRRDVPLPTLFLMFGAFIVACGLTHLMEIATIWHPVYWASGTVKFATAAISIATAAMLVRALPVIATLPSPDDLRRLNSTLEERVATRTADLSASNERLRAEVAQREQAEAEVRRLNLSLEQRVAELQALLDALPVGVGISRDPTCRDIRTNRAFATILGIGPEANASLSAPAGEAPTTFEVRHDGRLLAPHELPIQRAVAENLPVLNFEETIHRADGTVTDLVVNALPLRDPAGHATGAVATFQDITALKAAQDELRLVVEAAPNALLKIDAAHRITLVNAQTLALFGYTREELLGQPVGLLVPERFRSPHDAHIGGFLAAPGARAMGSGRELFGRRKDGTEVPIEVGLNPIRTRQGLVVLAAIIDVTQRRQAERERLEFERRLLESQKRESLGVLAGGIAHDFNNLLTGVIGHASLLRYSVAAEHPATLPHVDGIEQSAHRAATLCRQMLDYAGQGHFVIQPFDVNRMIRQHESLLRVAVSKLVGLDIELDEPLRLVRGDAKQIHQALTNLVINASEAIGERPGRVAIRTRLRRLSPADLAALVPPLVLKPGWFVSLVVADDGCGMGPDTVARVFEPFFTTKFIGRGLGLAALLGIMRSHQGGIFVRSTPGLGTEFELLFPALEDSAAPFPADSRPPVAVPAERGTVLVIDDEACVRDVARETLVGAGYAVVLAFDGQEGVDAFRPDPAGFIAVLLDVKMPRLNGEDTLFLLRQLAPRVPILVMSGYDENTVQSRFLAGGVSAFVPKPFRPAALLSALEDAIRRARRPADSTDTPKT